jgi:hypothetical protein
MRQWGDSIRGTIQRYQPEHQSHRRWKFVGRLRGDAIIAVYWSKDTVSSSGCWYVVQKNDFKYTGSYLSLRSGNEQKGLMVKKLEGLNAFEIRLHLIWRAIGSWFGSIGGRLNAFRRMQQSPDVLVADFIVAKDETNRVQSAARNGHINSTNGSSAPIQEGVSVQ